MRLLEGLGRAAQSARERHEQAWAIQGKIKWQGWTGDMGHGGDDDVQIMALAVK